MEVHINALELLPQHTAVNRVYVALPTIYCDYVNYTVLES